MKSIFKLCIFLILLWPISALAVFPQQIKSDFSPVSGYVIMPVGEEYLVDLDASDRVQEGDILTLITPGEKVIHPVTKEVLGTLDTARGFLQVTRLKSGYSYAKLLTPEFAPEKGAQVKRFEQVPAVLVAEPRNDLLRDEIKAGLPHLEWVDDPDESNAMLIFSLTGNSLTVSDKDGARLKSYTFNDSGELIFAGRAEAPTAVTPAAPNKSLLNQTANSLLGSIGLGNKEEVQQGAAIIQSRKPQVGIWRGPNLKENPVGLVVADFDNDGRRETAVAFESSLLITEISQGEMIREAEVEFPSGTKLLSIDVIDSDGDGLMEIYLSAVSGSKLSSQVVEFRGQSYVNTISRIPWFLKVAVLTNGERVLLGQSLGSAEAPFKEPFFRVKRSGDELSMTDRVELPGKINLFSFIPAGTADNQQLLAYVTPDEYLKVISEQGDEFWASDEHYGGSDVSFYPEHNANRELINPVYIQQRMLKNSEGDILVVQNEGIRTLQRFREFKKSRIVAFTWNGYAMQESWMTADQNGYLADFALADADNDGMEELVMVVKYQQKSLFSKGRSSIVIYELGN